MLSRIAAIFTVLYISSLCNLASAEGNVKICEHCRKMAATGSSPYEILWTLRGGIGKELVSSVLERKMFLRVADLKQAEGVFLEYCRNLCLHTLEGKIWDKMGKSNYKKDRTLHFNSPQEEEKYTKLGKKEFKKLKKKNESALGAKKTTEAKKKQTTERSSTKKNSYTKIYNDLIPNLNFLNGLSSSRSLQPVSLENLTVDSIIPDDAMELSLRQTPDLTTVEPGSDSNATHTTDEDDTTDTSLEMTDEDTTEEAVEATTLSDSESDESTESYDDSYEDDSKEEESDESQEQNDKSHGKDDIENLIKYVIGLTSDPDSDMILKRAASLARTIVKCMIDITMTEVERALGITPGSLVRERCGTSDEQNSLESTIVNFLKDVLEQYSNLQSAVPLSELILPPPVLQPPPVFPPELPPISKFQPNYPDLQAHPQYYDYYDEGVSQQGFPNLIPPPFIPQNQYYEEEPINYPYYPDYPQPEPFNSFPDSVVPPPQPFLPSMGSANIFENFHAWRRTMSDIRKDEGNPDEE